MLVDASALTTSRKTQIEFRLKLAEAVAVHHHKFEVLERIVFAFLTWKIQKSFVSERQVWWKVSAY